MDPILPIRPIGTSIPQVAQALPLRRVGPDQGQGQQRDRERKREPSGQGAGSSERRVDEREDRFGPHIDISA